MEPSRGVGALPNFLIIGAQKSGTTTLRAALDSHPQAMCAREIHFFDEGYDRGLDWYREHFAGFRDRIAIGEKCPDYLPRPDAMTRIANDLPDAKLIVILRHPVDRAYSNYWHERRVGREALTFAEALDAEPERAKSYPPGANPFGYVERGMYLGQLMSVSEAFPRERLLVLLFDDLRSAREEVFEQTCRFLGIDPAYRPEILGERLNVYRTYRPLWLWEFMNKRHLWKRLPAPVAKKLWAAMERPTDYEPISSAERRRLLEVYAPHNAALAAWLGRDLSRWDE